MTTIQKTQFTFDRIYGKLLDSEILGYTFYLQKNAEADTIGWREFKAKGKTLWFLCAAPTFANGTVDYDNGMPVEEWDLTELEPAQLAELFEIQARLYDAANGHFWYK